MTAFRRLYTGTLALVLCGMTFCGYDPLPANAATLHSMPGPLRRHAPTRRVAAGTLRDGRTAVVFSNGTARIQSKDRSTVEYRVLSPEDRAMLGARTPQQQQRLLNDLMLPPPRMYAPQTVNVVFRAGTTFLRDVTSVAPATLLALRKAKPQGLALAAPRLTNDHGTDVVLARLGVDRAERIARSIPRVTLEAMHQRAESAGSRSLDISNAFSLHITGASVEYAAATLRALPSVAYASPDWTVAPAHVVSVPIPERARREAQQHAFSFARPLGAAASNLPTNYGITSSLQSYQNAPGIDSLVAYDEIAREFGQLPGQGEIITNVSVGDLDDVSAQSNPYDPCNFYSGAYGPTTTVIGGQRYLDLPSMPLIPAYAADSAGNLNGDGEICGVDPVLSEIGLDFSVMAPLPHNMQRGGEVGSGITDLLGIAPGASYRLVVVGTVQQLNTNSFTIGALLGAATQSPAPNVITASLGFGFDNIGFPGRFLEEDPLTQAVIAAIVHGAGIPVCISANDGTRAITNVSIGPSGGSAPTDLVTGYNNAQTSLDDIGYSTAPSNVYDSGSLDVGGTTTDDIFAFQPQGTTRNGSFTARQPFAETRFDGFTSFASGEGPRVNVAAPSDNVVALAHAPGGNFDSVSVGIAGGTSASAPETAAAAAVALQVGRLTGHPFPNVASLRTFLQSTGTPVLQASNADPIGVGTQVDLGRAVESLLQMHGKPPVPRVARVAIAQRRSGDFNLAPYFFGGATLDAVYQEDTDPTAIDLAGPVDPDSGRNSDEDANAYITIAPDWENVPPGATFRLAVVGHDAAPLAVTRFARLLPAQILAADGLPLASLSSRTVKLHYGVYRGNHLLVDAPFSLTFGPADPTSQLVFAPVVPGIVTGPTIPVAYDISHYPPGLLQNPTLIVSYPGRTNPSTGPKFFAAYSVPVTGLKGTIDVPVDKLQGGGVYGIGIQLGPAPSPYSNTPYSDFAYTRISPAGVARANAPVLSQVGSSAQPTHTLEIPYGAPLHIAYDVSGVKGATGALIEVSATGTHFGLGNPFNNPNGTVVDANGRDTGSIDQITVSGTTGSQTFNTLGPGSLRLTPAMDHVIRVIPTSGGVPAGEASDVSDVFMDGVQPADGGYITQGFGTNANGNDGFLTTYQITADGSPLASVETFRQSDNSIVNPAVESSSDLYYVIGWGVFGNDTGVVADQSQNGTTVSLLNPTTGALGNTLSLPPQPFLTRNFAPDISTTTPALSYFNIAFAGDLVGNTFGAPVDLSKAAQPSGNDAYNSFAANNATNEVVTEFYSLNSVSDCTPGQILWGNVKTGQAGGFAGPGFNAYQVGAIAIDSTSNKAAVFSACNGALATIDLSSQATQLATVPGLAGVLGSGVLYTIVDETHKLVFVHAAYSADQDINNNALSSILTFDENGDYLGANENFFFYNAAFLAQPHFLTVNPTTRRGYDFGPLLTQLEPFDY